SDSSLQIDVRLLQRVIGFAAPVHFEAQRRQIRHGTGEALLVSRPLARRTDVLVADDADDLVAAVDGRVEHRGNAERLEIEGEKLARARIAACVMSSDDTVLFDRGKV